MSAHQLTTRNVVLTAFGALWLLVAVLAILFSARASAQGAPAPDKKTERLWKAKCASCHGAEGKGDTEKGTEMGMADLSTSAWQKSLSDLEIKRGIVNGVKRTKNGKKQEMDPFKDKLQPEQIDALVAYVRTLAK
jgi:mono/diheme cytochrome c family protein